MRTLSIWLALVATASAEPRTDAGLVWNAPATCPDAGDVRARIERRLGMPIDLAVHGIAVEITPASSGTPRGFIARIDLRGVTVANEIRVLTSARCDELTDAVAVVIARLAAEIHLTRAADRSLPIAVHVPEPVAPRAWGGGVRTLGLSGVGAQPSVGVGGELAAYARYEALFAELAEAWWLPRTRTMHPGAPVQLGIRLNATALRLGWGPEVIPLRAWIAGELGSIEGTGIAPDEHLATALWVGAGAGVGVTWPMAPRVRLVGVLEVVVPFQRPQFALQDGAGMYRPDVATARCGLGLEVGWR